MSPERRVEASPCPHSTGGPGRCPQCYRVVHLPYRRGSVPGAGTGASDRCASYRRVVVTSLFEEDPMSTTMTPDTARTVPSRTSRIRAAIVSVILAAGAVAIAAMVLWQPWGERDHLSYADLAPHRDAMWLGTVIDGLAFAAVGF